MSTSVAPFCCVSLQSILETSPLGWQLLPHLTIFHLKLNTSSNWLYQSLSATCSSPVSKLWYSSCRNCGKYGRLIKVLEEAMAIKLYKYCYVFATLLIAQPLFSFISNIQKVFYLQLFVLNLKQFSAQKLCVFTDHSSYEGRRICSILWWLKLSDSVTAVCVLTSL